MTRFFLPIFESYMERKRFSYWKKMGEAAHSVLAGLHLTIVHLIRSGRTRPVRSISADTYFLEQQGIATIQYPHQVLPVPDNGRYRLHNEIDDCIVCDKCAKICPVNCIYIEPIRAVEEFGKTSDGTPKRIYAAKFDIDMGKCCFCGLCTTVCPTECLTMTRVFDFSVTDIREHNFPFADLSETEIIEKKKLFEEHQKARSASTEQPSPGTQAKTSPPARPVFKPKMKPPGSPPTEG